MEHPLKVRKAPLRQFKGRLIVRRAIRAASLAYPIELSQQSYPDFPMD